MSEQMVRALRDYREHLEEKQARQAAAFERFGRALERFKRLIRSERLELPLRRVELKRSATGAGVEEGRFSGMAALFGESHPTSSWALNGNWNDSIMPGAFKESLAAHAAKGTQPALLLQHDMDSPIGVYTDVRETASGLFVEGRLALNTIKGRETYELLKLGEETGVSAMGLSIGFVVTSEELDQKAQLRRIRAVDLIEISPVSVPAIPGARVSSVK